MASTPEGRHLTEAHRQAQQNVRDGFLAEFIALWALLDSTRLDETGPGWVLAVMNLVREWRTRSAEVSAEYFWRFQAVEAPSPVSDLPAAASPRPSGPMSPPAAPRTGRPPRRQNDGLQGRRDPGDVIPNPRQSRVRFDFDEELFRPDRSRRTRIEFEVPDLDDDRNDRATQVSLIVTGPVGQKSKRSRGKTAHQARDESFVESSGAASRQVLTGGRQSLLTLMQDNMPEPRWIRVTDSDPCAFCAMLASRGPVYATKASAGFEAHDHCACTAEPVYYTDALWPGRAAEFRRLWREHIEGRYSGADARREWRRVYERLRREQRAIA